MACIKPGKWWVFLWVSEWFLFKANSAIFQLYHGENKLIFNEMAMRLSWIFIVLAHWNNSLWVDMSLHGTQTLGTLFWFKANQSLLFLLKLRAYRRSKKYQYYSLWFDPNPWSTAFKASTLTIMPPMRLVFICVLGISILSSVSTIFQLDFWYVLMVSKFMFFILSYIFILNFSL